MTMPKLSVQKIAAIVVGVLSVTAGVFFGFRALSSRASSNEPQNVKVSEINENAATVSWTSGTEAQCTLQYGTTPAALTFFGPETLASTNHNVKLSLLSPKTTYYFQIKCGESTFTNAGVPWSFSTTDPGSGSVGVATPSAALVPSPTTSALRSPTARPTTSVRPPPIQTLKVPENPSCPETDCAAVKAKLGQGCNTQDYFKCLRKPTEASEE